MKTEQRSNGSGTLIELKSSAYMAKQSPSAHLVRHLLAHPFSMLHHQLHLHLPRYVIIQFFFQFIAQLTLPAIVFKSSTNTICVVTSIISKYTVYTYIWP